jgi:hypothetical protein
VYGEPGRIDSPGYWVRHARDTVRFADAVDFLRSQGVSGFLEVGPDAVLSAMGAFIPAQRRSHAEVATLVDAVGALHVAGVTVDWSRYFDGTGAQRVELPTYAFQHERFWLTTRPSGIGSGLDHPWLTEELPLPHSGETVYTGRLSIRTDPWLADHAVFGNVVLPGAGFTELALYAGARAGCESLAELTLSAPLVLRPDDVVSLQVVVGAPDEAGRRSVTIHSRTGDDSWTPHAVGLVTADPATPSWLPEEWPPTGGTQIPVEDAYARLAASDYDYGPAFQAVRAVWLRGGELFAELALPESATGRFGVHPALLDAALHPALIAEDPGGTVVLPFAWSGVALHAPGARAARVRLTGTSIDIADDLGRPVLTVAALAGRPISAAQLGAGHEKPLGLHWRPLAATGTVDWLPWRELPSDGPVPEAVVLDCASLDTAITHQVLEIVQTWLRDDRYARSRLAVVTTNAAAGLPVDRDGLTQSAAWGLVRAAQAEHPGRFVLIDVDGTPESWQAVAPALASGEPELAIREGAPRVPRLTETVPAAAIPDFGDGAVLITGGTGGLGAQLARWLVGAHGVRRLLLLGRRGLTTPGATDLADELTELGAVVKIQAADVSDRDALAGALATIDGPLTGVFHAAGVLADGTISSMTPALMDKVFAAKADAAWHLHELTRDEPLAAFVVLSSAAGTLGASGQANYAAANVYLDALIEFRRGLDLPGASWAWGLWEDTGMGSGADAHKLATEGFPPLSTTEGLALADSALSSSEPYLALLKLDLLALRTSSGDLPPVLRDLIPRPRPAAQPDLADRLRTLSASEREPVLLDLVRTHTATVLGHDRPSAVDPHRGFLDIGFDSLAAVELRNRLATATGRTLNPMLVFDHPNVTEVVAYLLTELTDPSGSDDLSTASADELFSILDTELNP